MSNLKLALDEYDAQQRRHAALIEAHRIGNLIHLQEQQLVAAKHLAKQRKNAKRQQSLQQQLPPSRLEVQQQPQQLVVQPALDTLAECAVEEEEEEEEDISLASSPTGSASGHGGGVAARRAARRAHKLASIVSLTAPHAQDGATEPRSPSSLTEPSTRRYALHKRRPQEPYAVLASRRDWKPDSHASCCDNILCRKEFTLFGEKRHHCRRCGNIFCAACLSKKEVLYDMHNAAWRVFPERLLASIFSPEPQPSPTGSAPVSPAVLPSGEPIGPRGEHHQRHEDGKPTPPSSPALTSLSSSFESGSSHASGDYFDAKLSSSASTTSSSRRSIAQPPRPKNRKPYFERRKVVWEKGTNEFVPTPVPENWREHVMDLAREESVCEDCHCALWGLETPTDRFYQKKGLMVEREEIAWAIWLQGLDKWDQCLRKHGLTLKKTLEEREKDKEEKRVALQTRRGSATSHTTTASSVNSSNSNSNSMRFPTRAEEANDDLDHAGRPMHANLYAWPTAPDCIRFTTAALKPAPLPEPKPKEAPSIFGMHRSIPRYIPTPTPPPAPVLTSEQAAAREEERLEKIEQDRQKRYRDAIEEFLGDAYAMGDLHDDFRRRIYYTMPRAPTKWESFCDDLTKVGLDIASRWRGDTWGGW